MTLEIDTAAATGLALDPALEELIRKATADEPAHRLPSVRVLRDRLAAWERAPQSTGATAIRRVAGASDLATIVVHPPRIGIDAPAHLAEAFHQALLEILARQPRVRVILRPIDVEHTGATAVDLFAGATEIEVTAPAGSGGQMALRLPLSADRLTEATATAAHAIAGLFSEPAGRRPTRPTLPADALDLYEQGRHLARDRLSLARAAELFVQADRLAPGARRQSSLAQMFAEAGGWATEVDDCFAGLAVADRCGLFDLYWLDRCPSLAIARDDPRFEGVRASVKCRYDAIQDALYGDRSADGDAPTERIEQ